MDLGGRKLESHHQTRSAGSQKAAWFFSCRALHSSEANVAHLFGRIGRVKATNNVDGLRLTLEDGRILHIRASGNAPELRCYIEAGDQNTA
ncbi:hypothetical protein ISN39_34815 (plasmid) [Rhizobium sp. 007]|nr:hypothetical protein ISN39_34815 [Rhizobium sp. 007]